VLQKGRMSHGAGVAKDSSTTRAESVNDPQRRPDIRIMLVDDHAVFRAGLRLLIASRPGMTVVAEAANH